MHPFRLLREIVNQSRLASELYADRLRFSQHPVVPGFVLAVIREIVTMPASED
jgi:hypothetical protein